MPTGGVRLVAHEVGRLPPLATPAVAQMLLLLLLAQALCLPNPAGTITKLRTVGASASARHATYLIVIAISRRGANSGVLSTSLHYSSK